MSARLSPAASLLRNSKLFALPPAISLPPQPPSSEPQGASDTATTVYPQYASIAKPYAGGNDWGLKRPLPAKITATTNNPVIRLVRGIDTPEHVADFENAAGHTLTLKKFHELNQAIVHELDQENRGSSMAMSLEDQNGRDSVFKVSHDNTTNRSESAPGKQRRAGVWPELSAEEVEDALPLRIQKAAARAAEREEQKPGEAADTHKNLRDAQRLASVASSNKQLKRWRYAGPSLTQMTGAEFDNYLNSLGEEQKTRLRQKVAQDLKASKVRRLRDRGELTQETANPQVTEEDIDERLRYLRSRPGQFGPLVAEILDLPEGMVDNRVDQKPWQYGRSTLATTAWLSTGPPRTHPSAGLSYLSDSKFANNDPYFGPQDASKPVIARTIMQKAGFGGRPPIKRVGVAGFVGQDATAAQSTTGHLRGRGQRVAGQKTLTEVVPSSVKTDGTFHLYYKDAVTHTYSMTETRYEVGPDGKSVVVETPGRIVHQVANSMREKANQKREEAIAMKAQATHGSQERLDAPGTGPLSQAGAAALGSSNRGHVTREKTQPLNQREFHDFVRQGSRARV